jgi:hypothetical protein
VVDFHFVTSAFSKDEGMAAIAADDEFIRLLPTQCGGAVILGKHLDCRLTTAFAGSTPAIQHGFPNGLPACTHQEMAVVVEAEIRECSAALDHVGRSEVVDYPTMTLSP